MSLSLALPFLSVDISFKINIYFLALGKLWQIEDTLYHLRICLWSVYSHNIGFYEVCLFTSSSITVVLDSIFLWNSVSSFVKKARCYGKRSENLVLPCFLTSSQPLLSPFSYSRPGRFSNLFLELSISLTGYVIRKLPSLAPSLQWDNPHTVMVPTIVKRHLVAKLSKCYHWRWKGMLLLFIIVLGWDTADWLESFELSYWLAKGRKDGLWWACNTEFSASNIFTTTDMDMGK